MRPFSRPVMLEENEAEMAELVRKLSLLRPTVREICRVSATAGVSVGVIHKGRVLFSDNFGYRDVENKKPPDENTIYYLASLSKSFTAAAISILVQQGKLDWDTPISQLYKDLAHEDPEICKNASILDFLSHRTGLAPKNHLWSQEFGHLSLRRDETVRIVTYLEKIAPFRKRWIYNNWGYGVADVLITRKSHPSSWGEYLKEHIFDPLGMSRTTTHRERDPDKANVAKGYMALEDGRLFLVPEPDGEDGDIIEGAMAVKSCIKDLLQYYLAFLSALQLPKTYPQGQSTPFPDAAKMVEPHIRLSTESPDLDGSYGLGWVRAKLPCTLGAIGMNHAFLDKMPIVDRGSRNRTTCFYHQGSANSFLSSVYLLPETESGVVVLTNSMAKNDAADWLGELYLETLLDSPHKNDYVRLAKNSAEAAMALWPAMKKELAENQIPNTPVRSFEQYIGRYYNKIGNYHIEVLVQRSKDNKENELVMRFQREKRIMYKLTHYHYDTFSWLLTHDQDVQVGRFPITRASYYLIRFQNEGQDNLEIDSLVWAHDDEVPEGETFFKRGGQRKENRLMVKAEHEAVPPPDTKFTEKTHEVKDRTVTLPSAVSDSISDRTVTLPKAVSDAISDESTGTIKKGKVVLVETQLEELTEGVTNSENQIEVNGKL